MFRNSTLKELLAFFAETRFADYAEKSREICEGFYGVCNELSSGSCLNSNLIELTAVGAATEEALLFLNVLVDFMKSAAEVFNKSTSALTCRFRCAMLHSLICPYLISVQMVSTPQVALALELSSSFIRLVGDFTEPEAIQAASDTLPCLNHIFVNAPISADSIASVIECVKVILTHRKKTVVLVTHSDLRVVAWTALWQVLSHPLSGNWMSQPFLHTGTGDSLLQSITKAAEDQLANAVDTSIDLHASLIGVLCELYCRTRDSLLDSIPLDCNNLDLLERLTSFSVGEICGEHNEIPESPEAFEEPKVRTLSVPASYYLNEEKKMRVHEDSQVKKHIDLFFFIFHRFMRICDLQKPNHPHALKRFLREVLRFRRNDLIDYFSVNNNQVRKWLSDVVSDALGLLRTQQPQNENTDHSIPELLVEFLEFFCAGNESESLPAPFQTTPVQLRSLLQIAIGTKSRKLQLRVVRLLVKWSSRADPLEPEHFLAWPQHQSFLLPANLHQSQIADPSNTSVFKNFAFARSSIPLDHWQFDPAQPYPQTLISTIWPLSVNQHPVDHDRQPTSFNADSSGLAVAMWYKLLHLSWCLLFTIITQFQETPAEDKSTFDANLPLSGSTLANLALQGEMLHLFTLEESPTFLRSPKLISSIHSIEHAHSARAPQPRTIPSLSCWSIEVWLVPSTRGVYTRIRRKCDIGKQHFMPNHSAWGASEVILFGDAYLSDALDSNFWGHMLFSILWKKNSKPNLTGTVSITTNASTYTESTINLSPLVSASVQNRNRAVNFVHSRRFTTNLRSLSLWIGHANAALGVPNNATSKKPYLFTSGFLVFTGDILPKMPSKVMEGSRAQLRELALYCALCGPSWNGILPCSSQDVWPTLSARGRCHLNSLLSRLRPQELGDLFMRGRYILGAVEQFRGGTTIEKMRSSGCFQAASKLWMVDPATNRDVEVTAQNINALTKCSVDATIASLGGIDTAFFLAGAVACAPEADTEVIAASLDFILTLTRHSVVAAEKFYRPLSEELIPWCSADAFDRLHITNYGLCLLTSLINRLCLRRANLAFQEVLTKHAYVNVVNEGIRLLIDPELIVCQMMFSSLESLPAMLSVMGDCFINANGSFDRILACNIASVDEARLIEAAVTSFRVCFPTLNDDENVNRAFEATSVSLSRLLSQRLAVQPSPTALLTFLLQTLTSVDPDLYHGAATRAFDAKTRETPLGVDLTSLTRSRLQFLQLVAIPTFDTTSSSKGDGNVAPNAEVHQLPADEASEEGAEQHLSSPPLGPTISIPLIPLQPSFTLEGASDAEAATLARFRENILASGGQCDSSLSSTLFGSCSSLLEFGNLDLVEEEREKECESCSSLTRYRSLPDISMPMVEPSSSTSQSVTETSAFSSSDEAIPSENQDYSTAADSDIPTISPLRLSQRHHLAALTLSALAQFWQTAAAKAAVGTERKMGLSVPPFWLIYHLSCHPCVKFREYALSLYITLLSMHPDRKMCHSPTTDCVLAMQFLSDTSSITFRYCSSVTEAQCTARCVLDPDDCSLAHVALTSQSLVASACKVVDSVVNSKLDQTNEPEYSFSTEDGVVVPTSIALAIIASSLVDIETFQQIYNEKSVEEALLAKATDRGMDCLDSLSNFFNFARTDSDVLISLRNPFSLYILLEIAFFLQSTCSATDGINVYTERFHEIGNSISRLLGSIISRVKDRLAFADVKAIIFHLRFGGDSVDEMDRPDASDTESLHSQLRWTAVAVEDTLLFKGSTSPLEPLTADPSSPSCPQFSTIHLLEKAIITLFVNSASHAMRNARDAIWSILSSSLMRLLHTWCEALLETLTISTTGLWLLTLLSQEPHIIGDEAVSCCPNILMELRNNLQMLEAVFSIKPRKSDELQCNQEIDSDAPSSYSTCRSDCVDDRGDTARRKIDYDRVSNAVQILLEWVEKLCFDFEHTSKKSSQHALPNSPLSTSETNFCPPLHIDQFDWLSPLREANEAGQRHWSMLVSQHRHILAVVAPFYWMQLGGAMSHECSVFCTEALKPAFSHVDTFEDESRQRCRRRPVVIWIDDRFVRPSSVNALGQYLKSHPLSPLMMHQSTYTPARGLARKRCLLTPQIQFPPSCQALFPPPVALSDRCLGVWSCRLVGISDSLPLDGDLTLDTNWIRLVINDKELFESPMRNRNCSGALMHGLGEDGSQKEVLTCPLHTIARVEERRFELRDLALELFFERACNMAPIMIAFRSNKERDYFIRSLVEACGSFCTRPLDEWWRVATGRRMTFLGQATSVRSSRGPRLSLRDICDVLVAPFPTPFVGPTSRARLLDAQVAWLRGQMSNFDYIMALNTAAGRTYNDVTQYPIFPWILADYESEVLDLEKTSSSFRRLDRPISVQTESRMMAVSRHYEEMKAQSLEIDVVGGEEQRTLLCPIFHYPSFCSNEAIILHLLFRLIPYSFRLIQFQDGNFDDPNRLFHSIASEWSLTTSSTAFAKELVPEFYFRPDMFVNCENFELGTRHDGEIVDSVELPPWAKGDPRLFVLVNRAALESPYVTAHIPEWIDLVFGYKQTGRWGERAINLYHPFTYFGAIDVDNIEDPLRRAAVQSMIRNYGQAPRQLFPNHPHPRRTTSFITAKTSTDSRRYSDFFNLSRLIRYILSRQQATLTLRKMEDHDESQPLQSVTESPIAMVKSFSAEEEEEEVWPSSGVSVAASIVPLTAGAPLDTVKGLRWGKWAGSPLLEPLCQHLSVSSENLFDFDDLVDGCEKVRGSRTNHKVRLSSSHVTLGWRCLIGHTGAKISCVDTCVQHGLIASGDAYGRVAVWDLASTAFIALLEMDESSGVFERVCGLAFDQTLGDLLVARAGPTGPHGCQVGCVLIGGPSGCLIWLSSWTLNTISVMRCGEVELEASSLSLGGQHFLAFEEQRRTFFPHNGANHKGRHGNVLTNGGGTQCLTKSMRKCTLANGVRRSAVHRVRKT
ncbi:Lysosomal-trafficking regulator [Taenia solium]|eukprot:TsM_001229900 transcript=TsM_001229900 gene=TsM_001229900